MRVALTDFKIPQAVFEEMCARARAAAPLECCGLLGGREAVEGEGRPLLAQSIYPLRNASPRPDVAYEAAPEELFEAQRRMRVRGERLVALYHSHPRSSDPAPSAADVRLAFYPDAVYFIIGFEEGGACAVRAFRIFEREGRWQPAAFEVEH